jgi:hypothetical protein
MAVEGISDRGGGLNIEVDGREAAEPVVPLPTIASEILPEVFIIGPLLSIIPSGSDSIIFFLSAADCAYD